MLGQLYSNLSFGEGYRRIYGRKFRFTATRHVGGTMIAKYLRLLGSFVIIQWIRMAFAGGPMMVPF